MTKRRYFLLISSLLLFVGFVLFSYLVAKEKFVQFDFDTTVKIQDRLSSRVIEPFSLISVVGSVEITALICLIIMAFLASKKLFLAALSIFLLPIGLMLEIFGKLYVYHPGPPYFMHRTNIPFSFPSFYVHTDYSYPSGHTLRLTFITIVVLLIIIRSKYKLSTYLALPVSGLLILLVGISRIYLGEHWTTDVIGGTLLGSSLALITGVCLPDPKS